MPDQKTCPLIGEECRKDGCEWFDDKAKRCFVVAIRGSLKTLVEKSANMGADLSAAIKRGGY